MVRALLFVCLFSTSAAWAQGITLRYSQQEATTLRFNAESCNTPVTVIWTNTITFPPVCGDLRLWATELECGDAPMGTDVAFASVTQLELAMQTGDFVVNVSELPGFKYGDAGVTCGTQAVEKPHKICGSYKTNGGGVAGCEVQTASSLTLTYDTRPPPAPVIESIVEQDSALLVTFSATTDTATVRAESRAMGETNFTPGGEVVATTSSSIKVQNLVNGTTYDVQLRAEDSARNISGPSEVFSGTPRRTKGFWAAYREGGGTEKGGCSAIHGFPLLLAGGLWLLRRKRN